ncbi:MAG: hypothetical protein GXY76_21355 [Chloroflexi bacterium]|nr:hypothetical protein [Chloroflexota bacterium]
MSYQDGWAAINLEMPARVPHTEYSVTTHWGVIEAVTGIKAGPESSQVKKQRAGRALERAWDFDFAWSTLISHGELGEYYTDMGHAVYAAGGVDWRIPRASPHFQTPEDVLRFDPWESLGQKDLGELKARFEEAYARNARNNPNQVNMTGVYITMISGMIGLFGWDLLLLAAGTDPVAFGEVANRYARWIQQYYDALGAADLPMVMVHDDIVWSAGPFISPKWYREYIFPNYKKLFAPLVESGKKIAFTSDGNYTMFIDDIAACGISGFVMEPTTDMGYIAERYGRTHFFIGNADTRILLGGDKAAIRAEVERCMSIGKRCPGYFLAVGNHIPPNTPVDAVLYYQQVYEELCKR